LYENEYFYRSIEKSDNSYDSYLLSSALIFTECSYHHKFELQTQHNQLIVVEIVTI